MKPEGAAKEKAMKTPDNINVARIMKKTLMYDHLS